MGRRRVALALAEPAEHDLANVAAWYVERHPSGERRFVEAFAEVGRLLSSHPDIGQQRDELHPGLRSWLVHPYVVFYLFDGQPRVITIVRVLHQRMDVDEVVFVP
ncbi:MAG: type II toxin-antitoxin system RelE/ParE family toxin [bacterium]|nr:type II toxin-antitoxin system RelE/ParE family toxin [bacterium]